MIDTNELRNDAKTALFGHTPLEVSGSEMLELLDRLEAAEKECDDVAQQLVQSEIGKRKISEQRDEAELMSLALRAKLEAAEKENKILREALAEKVTNETILRDLSVGNGSVNASFEGGAVHLLVEAFADQFSESGAENYLEMHFHSPATGPLVATLQRVNGKTPHQLREAAEKERDNANAAAAGVALQAEALQAELSEAHNTVTRQLSVLADENTALRAKIAEMEKQEPVAEWINGAFTHYPHLKWKRPYKAIVGAKLYTNIYALPGAKGEEE